MSLETGHQPPPWATCFSALLPFFLYLKQTKTLFISNLNLPFSVCAISPCFITTDPAEESVPFLLTAFPLDTESCYQVTLESSLG